MTLQAYVLGKMCLGCGNCVNKCPFGAMTKVGDIVKVDGERCQACEECLETCMVGAITFKPKETEKGP